MSLNAFSQFTLEFRLIQKRSKFCNTRDFDQLFISVDSSNLNSRIAEKYNRRKALNRREWLQILVQIATNKYIKSGEVSNVSTAMHALMYPQPASDPQAESAL